MDASVARENKPTAPLPLSRILSQINRVIVGKEHSVKLALACLLARGHLLIEDVPGVGKTTLAHTLSRVLGLPLSRIQFTSDLLPADVIGVSVYDKETAQFRFHPGPIFAPVVLADEINRATPKAQSALLEAMEERQISAEGKTYPLPEPFFVIATQNPHHQIGTFPLPESQLDRFLMRVEIGYPDRASERQLLKGADRRDLLEQIRPVCDASSLGRLQQLVRRVHTSDALLDYVQDILAATRTAGWLQYGLSPRAGMALVQAARAWALVKGRDLVLPEDIQTVAPGVLGHRMQPVDDVGQANTEVVRRLIESVAIP